MSTIKTKLKHSYKELTTKWNLWRVFPELALIPYDLSDAGDREGAGAWFTVVVYLTTLFPLQHTHGVHAFPG